MQWTPTSSPNRTANRVKIDITTYAPNLLIKFGAYAFIYAPIDSAERRLRQGAETTVFILRKHTKKKEPADVAGSSYFALEKLD